MKNYLQQRSKSLLAFAVGLTILSSAFAGEVYAAEYYYNGWDMANDSTTTWDDETQTATLNADRSIYRTFAYSISFGLPTQPEVQFASLGTSLYTGSGWQWNSYNVAGATKSEKLTLYGDIIATQTNKLTVHDLDTLKITNGTYGLEANEGNKTDGGLYLSNIKNVDVSGTVSAIYSDVRGKVELNNIGTLNLTSNINRVSEYGGKLTATEDNTITCDYGSIVNINATNTTITSTGRAILATAHSVDNINHLEDAIWETDTPWPQVNINSNTLTIAAATSGPTAAAVYSDTGAIINLGIDDAKKIDENNKINEVNKIGRLIFDENAGASMNLYSSSYIYKEETTGPHDRYSNTIPTDNYNSKNLHQSQINVYAEYAEFNANTNAINAHNKALINVKSDNAVINSNYGNVATVAASAGATVTIEGNDLAITNNNTNYLKNAQVVEKEDAKIAIGSGGLLNPSRADLVEEYGATEVNAGDIVIKAANNLNINGNIVIKANPDAAAGNSISINKGNDTALVNITGDIYTDKGNEVHLTLGDGSAASQAGNAAGRQAGRSTLTGAILDKASTAAGFSFSDANFSAKGTNLNMKNATWNVTADSEAADVKMDVPADSEAATVAMAGSSTIDLTHDHGFQKLKINNLSGTIRMDYDDSQSSTDGSTADKLFINNHSGTHCLYLNEVNGATSLTGNAEGTVLVSVVTEGEDSYFKAASDDNLTWNIYELNKKQSTTTGYNIDWYLAKNTNPTPAPQDPTRAEAATLKAHNMNYYLWRDQSERLTKRLGITCFDEECAGVWTKMSNSDISGSGIYGSDAKVKTYTIGYDFKHNSDEHLTAADANKTRDFSGLAFTYIKGSSSMDGYKVSDALQVAGGRSDIRGGALTAYHTHTSQSGSYADYVLRYSSYDNDFKLDGINGSAKSHGLQASAEYGCRLENNHGLFVTPNAQFTLGRLYNKAFTTSDGVHVASDHLNSAILSMGVDVGQTLGDQSQFYAKVRYNTELGDRVSAAFYKGDKSDFCSGDSNGSWWEYGLGFDIKAGHASHLFMDAERASGSGFSKDWSWRIGARFDF